jgi:Na+/glutamate symporter
MFEDLQHYIIDLASIVPIELFAVLSSFLEEIVAPIPSPLIGTLLGSLALAGGHTNIIVC